MLTLLVKKIWPPYIMTYLTRTIYIIHKDKHTKMHNNLKGSSLMNPVIVYQYQRTNQEVRKS